MYYFSNSGTKKKSFHSYKLLNDKISNFSAVNILRLGHVTNINTSGGNGIWAIHFVVNGTNKRVLWSPNNQPYSLAGIYSNDIKVTKVVPVMLIIGRDSAVFNTNTYVVNAGTFNFTTLTSLPILIEEVNATSVADNYTIENRINIYPNPTSSNAIIEFNHLSYTSATLNIYNVLGQLLKR